MTLDNIQGNGMLPEFDQELMSQINLKDYTLTVFSGLTYSHQDPWHEQINPVDLNWNRELATWEDQSGISPSIGFPAEWELNHK